MDLAEYSRLDGVALAGLVRTRKVSPKELAQRFTEAVEKVNPRINAIIEVWSDRIARLDDRVVPDGPFGGVPFLMKDLGAGEAGRRQDMGSRLTKGHLVERDAFLTERFRKAGLNLLGRTTTPELGMGCSTESILTGATRNPWDLSKMAGGSSGGSAASVAAGVVPVAHASDMGGSIRIPASACGLVGLKPSRGRVTAGPDIGEGPAGSVIEFAVSRTVRDSAAMLDAVSAPAPGDPFVILQPGRPYLEEVGAPLESLRIAWTTDPWKPGASVDSEVAQCVETVATECERAGHSLVEASPAFDYEAFLDAICKSWGLGLHVLMDTSGAAFGRRVSEETVEPVMLSYYEYSRGLTAADGFMSEFTLNKLRRGFGRFFETYDVLLTPTLTRLPEPLGTYSKLRTDLDFVGFMRLTDETKAFCPPASVTGQPAISLPLGQSRSALPIGVQFMGRFGREDILIRLASWLEHTLPWRDRIPDVHASR